MSSISSAIDHFAAGPDQLERAVAGLTSEQLQAFPVPGTWSIQQIVCHVLDSDLIGSHRIKKLIAEDTPRLAPYDETLFAQSLFYQNEPIAEILQLFRLNRAQTVRILRQLPEEAFARRGVHEQYGEFRVDALVEHYAEHVDHHLKFILEKRAMLGNSLV